MRFKLDEHFDARIAALVAEGGHDVETLVREGLAGADDDAVYDACRREARTLQVDPRKCPANPEVAVFEGSALDR